MMKVNKRQQLAFFLLVILMLTGMIAVRAQTADCEGTLKAWEADSSLKEFMATHRCTCTGQNSRPECTANGGGGDADRSEADARMRIRMERINRARAALPPGNSGTSGTNTDNAAAAEAERKQRDEEFKLKQESLTGGLKTGNSANSGNLGLKPSSNIIREQTVKRIKELNCSAYWALQAFDVALRTRSAVTPNLEDEYTQARRYAEFSAQAKGGKSVEGCPEAKKIDVPDVPPPLDSNPQIQFYEQLIVEAQNLAPQMIDTSRKMLETGTRLKETETAKKSEARKLGRIKLKPNTPANKIEKKKIISKIDEFDGLLADLQGVVKALKEKAEKEEANAKEIQTKFDSGP